jgi:tripartite-type tricarboxylate transporter receptor subunit TctC
MQEAGVPGYTSQGAFGLFAPAGTPKDIIAKVHADTAEVLADPEVRKALEARSFVVEGMGPAEFDKFIAGENVKWQKVIKAADIRIN